MSDSEEEYSEGSEVDDGGYKVRGVLKAYRVTHYAPPSLFEWITDCSIDLEPDYQRGDVWNKEKQSMLIDSIFRNFYIPPIIFAVSYNDEDEEKRTCIDGKQRLTAIVNFMEGKVPLKDPDNPNIKFWYKVDPDAHKRSRPPRLLPSNMKRSFDLKQIVCVEYNDLSADAERDIFQRVQLGMALTPAEKLAVIATPRSDFARETLKKIMTEEALASETFKWDYARGNDFRCVAGVMFLLSRPFSAIHSFPSIPQLTKWLSDNEAISTQLRDKVNSTFDAFAEVLKLPPVHLDQLVHIGKKIAPVEVVGMALLIAEHKDHMNTKKLCESMAAMRRDVHHTHEKRVLMNSQVSQTLLQFIKSLWSSSSSSKRKMAVDEDANGGPAPAAKRSAGAGRGKEVPKYSSQKG